MTQTNNPIHILWIRFTCSICAFVQNACEVHLQTHAHKHDAQLTLMCEWVHLCSIHVIFYYLYQVQRTILTLAKWTKNRKETTVIVKSHYCKCSWLCCRHLYLCVCLLACVCLPVCFVLGVPFLCFFFNICFDLYFSA